MADIFDKAALFTKPRELREAGVYPFFHALETRADAEVVMEGKRRIMLGSNNYLGLTVDERVVGAAMNALKDYGTGCSGSRFLNGTLDLHITLEEKLAAFLEKSAAMTFSTGFQSNLGIISAIVGRNDYVFVDRENHASIYDGCRLSFGKMQRYAHNNMAELERLLRDTPDSCGKLIVTDGVFSMSGDICRLPEIVALARKYGARVMVDDAHALGVLGGCGRGTADYFGLTKEVDIIMGTFSKSLASLGGYMAGDTEIVEFVRHNSRPFIFCASIPPSACAAALAALEVLQATPALVKRLDTLARYLREGLKKRGVKIIDSCVPIVPIYTYDELTTLTVNKALYDSGVYVNPVLPPAAPEGECLLRASLMATHTEELLDEAADIISRVLHENGL